MDELYKDMMQDYRFKGLAVELAERPWNIHLKDYFGGMKAERFGTVHISGYVEKRLGQKVAQSTINREPAPRRRAFSIGFDADPQKVARVRKGRKPEDFLFTQQNGEPVRDLAPPGLLLWRKRG